MINDRFSPNRLGDWVIFCDICGAKCFASESYVLEPETGKGGLTVCPSHRDKIAGCFIPYTVNAEKPVPFVKGSFPPVVNSNTSVYTLDQSDFIKALFQ
jgi:hypothetical protein